jgi:histidine triad (HIT) family protein
MEKCPFCKILTEELPSSVVYKDEICTVVMDIQPFNQGHVLVLPNEHFPDLQSLPIDQGQHLFSVAQKLAAAIQNSGIPCEGINLFVADGEAAMQSVPHFHLHVIPRFEGDGFEFQFSPRYAELPTRDELDKNASYIKEALEKLKI